MYNTISFAEKEKKQNKILYQSQGFGNQPLSNAIGMIVLHGLEENEKNVIHQSTCMLLIILFLLFMLF